MALGARSYSGGDWLISCTNEEELALSSWLHRPSAKGASNRGEAIADKISIILLRHDNSRPTPYQTLLSIKHHARGHRMND